jgi:hypothetical protein
MKDYEDFRLINPDSIQVLSCSLGLFWIRAGLVNSDINANI